MTLICVFQPRHPCSSVVISLVLISHVHVSHLFLYMFDHKRECFCEYYILVRCIQHVGANLSRQSILHGVACYENYCSHKERKKCTDVFKVTRHINDCTKIAGLEVACTVTWTV